MQDLLTMILQFFKFDLAEMLANFELGKKTLQVMFKVEPNLCDQMLT